MDATEVKTVIKNLEKAKDSKTILELLSLLKDGIKATESFLRETKVGVAVNKLRSHEDTKVSSLVKKIIKHWKEQVSADKKKHKGHHHTTSTANTTPSNKNGTSKSAELNSQVKIETNGASLNQGEFISSKTRNPANDGVKVNFYDNTTRNGSISGLYTALAIESKVQPDILLSVSKEIEIAVFNQNKEQISDGYRNKMRSLIMNLRNKQNPELRAKLSSHDIKPSNFINMTNAELAPDKLREQMANLHQKNLFDAQGAVEKRAVTDRFVCGKCKQREVSYYQMQTRSADEPLTTFCTCEKCGNRWKFC